MAATFKHLGNFGIMGVIALAVGLTGCGGSKNEEYDASVPASLDADENRMGDSDSGTAMGLQTVNFAYDSFSLTSRSKDALKANAEVLKDKSSISIQIEGHCDERGSIQYNLALGEKRANAVRRYLRDMGISGDRVTTISFGEERPIDPGHSDSAWNRNRRANFVITAK